MTTMNSGWGNGYLRGGIRNADNPPEAPKLSEGESIGESIRERLTKRRLGKEQVFRCQVCDEGAPATTQCEACQRVLCQDCAQAGCPCLTA